ncbi:MAG: phosphoribosylformylglycinamidine synthase subunit PurS [Candidatus Omnitrophota bacterium]|nr:phosphoribosylformylglycinamidine synthase subunit PurS [Candidatus Omnitrophota bacterium]
MKATVYITLKPGLLDAQGKTIKQALESLGFRGLRDVRMGKYLEIELNHSTVASAKKDVERMCRKLLANPVVEAYRIDLDPAHGASPKALSRTRARAT